MLHSAKKMLSRHESCDINTTMAGAFTDEQVDAGEITFQLLKIEIVIIYSSRIILLLDTDDLIHIITTTCCVVML